MDLRERLLQLRQDEALLHWHGTFWEYLEMVRENPKLARLSHARIYDMIAEQGTIGEGEQRRFRFFEDELFGLDHTLEQLVDYLHSAARRLEVRKRILLLMGPVGGGKSTMVTLLKRGLEAYTRTASGALYALEDCPMHEEPLHLIPEPLRAELEQESGVYVEGALCPVCQHRLEHEWGGRIEEVPVERLVFSEKHRVGIGTFAPSDPKSQDIAELTGSIDLATIGTYGSESDPRAFRFDGELNIANRGLMEFIELLKSDEKFLYGLLTLSQEQSAISPWPGRGHGAKPAPSCRQPVGGYPVASEWARLSRCPPVGRPAPRRPPWSRGFDPKTARPRAGPGRRSLPPAWVRITRRTPRELRSPRPRPSLTDVSRETATIHPEGGGRGGRTASCAAPPTSSERLSDICKKPGRSYGMRGLHKSREIYDRGEDGGDRTTPARVRPGRPAPAAVERAIPGRPRYGRLSSGWIGHVPSQR
jgi:energy-coupling factor transporter ATP-binding protein EcfA2